MSRWGSLKALLEFSAPRRQGRVPISGILRRSRRLTRRERTLAALAGSLFLLGLGGRLVHGLGERRVALEEEVVVRRRLIAVYRDLIARRPEILARATAAGQGSGGGMSDAEAIAALAQLASGITVEAVFPSATATVSGADGESGALAVDCRGDLTNLQHFLIRVEAEAGPFRIARCRLTAEGATGELACHLALTYARR